MVSIGKVGEELMNAREGISLTLLAHPTRACARTREGVRALCSILSIVRPAFGVFGYPMRVRARVRNSALTIRGALGAR